MYKGTKEFQNNQLRTPVSIGLMTEIPTGTGYATLKFIFYENDKDGNFSTTEM